MMYNSLKYFFCSFFFLFTISLSSQSGAYENPQLGIVDYTAFSRGLNSSLQSLQNNVSSGIKININKELDMAGYIIENFPERNKFTVKQISPKDKSKSEVLTVFTHVFLDSNLTKQKEILIYINKTVMHFDRERIIEFFNIYLRLLSPKLDFKDIEELPVMTKRKAKAKNENQSYTYRSSSGNIHKWYKTGEYSSFFNMKITLNGLVGIEGSSTGLLLFPFYNPNNDDIDYRVTSLPTQNNNLKMVYHNKNIWLWEIEDGAAILFIDELNLMKSFLKE